MRKKFTQVWAKVLVPVVLGGAVLAIAAPEASALPPVGKYVVSCVVGETTTTTIEKTLDGAFTAMKHCEDELGGVWRLEETK